MSVAASMPYLRAEDLPITSQHWQSLSQKVEFLPADEVFKGNLRKPAETLQRSRFLEESVVVASEDEESMVYNEYDPYSVQPFVEGIGEYDEYQQAWRMLGFMIDCNGYYYNDDDNSGGSNDEDVTEDGCRRYVLWAAVSACETYEISFL